MNKFALLLMVLASSFFLGSAVSPADTGQSAPSVSLSGCTQLGGSALTKGIVFLIQRDETIQYVVPGSNGCYQFNGAIPEKWSVVYMLLVPPTSSTPTKVLSGCVTAGGTPAGGVFVAVKQAGKTRYTATSSNGCYQFDNVAGSLFYLTIILPSSCSDIDGDGYGNPASPLCLHPETDCDDLDAFINPGASEGPPGDSTCSDLADNDCNGLTDTADPGCRQTAECAFDSDCDDTRYCNGAERCVSGHCQGGIVPNCSDGIPCTEDSCNELMGRCDHIPLNSACNDGNLCTNDTCDILSGCVYVNNIVPCDDGNACTVGDTCSAGSCVGGSPRVCNDGNVCTNDSCDSVLGCVYVNNTLPCNDGLFCTTGDTCSGGACISTAQRVCNDGDSCTYDYCDEAGDQCVYSCTAAGFGDPCCDALACAEQTVCDFRGGTYMVRVATVVEQPGSCLFGLMSGLLPTIADLLHTMPPIPVAIPPEGVYPTPLTLAVPILGTLQVTARFINGNIVFDPVQVDPIDLVQQVAPLVPPDLQPIVNLFLNCIIECETDGWTSGLTATHFDLTLDAHDFTVSVGSGTGLCLLTRPGPGSPCTLVVTLEGNLLIQ